MAAFPAPVHEYYQPDSFGTYVETNGTSATTIHFSLGTTSWGSNSPWRQEPPEPEESPKAVKLRLARAASRKAVLAALAALRRLRDDPDPRIPPLARRGLSGRPAARKRVCAGSSRYRVLVN